MQPPLPLTPPVRCLKCNETPCRSERQQMSDDLYGDDILLGGERQAELLRQHVAGE
jgi:hypothetical protein